MRRHSPRVLAAALLAAVCAGVLLYEYMHTANRPRIQRVHDAPTLTTFLADAKAAALQHVSARADARGALVLVLGNEAGDLDSAASAIALCYAIEHEYAHFARYGLPRARYVPVLQTRRSDLDQRRENLAVYAAVGIDAADLLCIDEVRDAADGALTPANNTFVGLVDHAALVPSWGSAAVLIVVDHHADVGAHMDAPLRIIYPPASRPAGSASSIVARLYAEALGGRPPARGIADLLLSAGVIDTRNYRLAPAGKATAIDEEARVFLQPFSSFASAAGTANMVARGRAALAHAPLPPRTPAVHGKTACTGALMDDWSAFMQGVKSDVGHLDAHQLLARDYKEGVVSAHKFGIASVPIGLHALVTGSYRGAADGDLGAQWRTFWRTAAAWMDERATDTLVVMLSHRKEGKKKQRRELVLVSRDCAHFGALVRGLEVAGAPGSEPDHPSAPPPLGLEEWHAHGTHVHGLRGARVDVPSERCAAVWRQKNTKANRKVLQPLLERLLQT